MIAAARTLRAELRKLATLPGIWIALAVTLVGSAAVTAINAFMVRNAVLAGNTEHLADTSPFEAGFAAVPFVGVVGAVVIGSLAIGSEYTADRAESGGARQITTSLAATPRRTLLFLAKAAAVVALTTLSAAIAIPGSYGLALAIAGEHGTETVTSDAMIARSLGAALYWVLMALIAFAITALARSVMIPLLALIANSSLVSVSLLLTMVTPLADWLPDMAGRSLFGLSAEYAMPGGLDTPLGALVMAAWAALLLATACVVFHRRDA